MSHFLHGVSCCRKRFGLGLLSALAGICCAGRALCALKGVSPDPEVLRESSSLQDYLRYAAIKNAGLESAFNRWKAALERIPQVKALPDPRFNYSYFVREVETRVGPQRQRFGLSQTFPWFGIRRLRRDAASEAAAAAHEEYEQAKLRLFYQVKSAYYEYWYLAQAIAVTKQHVQLVMNLDGVILTQFKAGKASHSSVIQVQVELGKLDDRLRALEALRGPILATLNASLNRPTQLILPWPRLLPEVNVSFTDTQAREWFASGNPELRRLDHVGDQELARMELAGKANYPDITVGVDYVDTGDALNRDMADSGKDPVIAMVSVNLPVWRYKYRAAERESRLRKAATDGERADTELRLGADLTLALYHFRDASRKIDLYGDTLVPKAEQALKVSQQGFEAGRSSFIELIDAQRSLLEFQLAHQRALSDRGRRLAEIEMLVNRDLSTPPANEEE